MDHYIHPPLKKLHLEVMGITILRKFFDGIYLFLPAIRLYLTSPIGCSHYHDVIFIYELSFSHMGCVSYYIIHILYAIGMIS